MRSIAFILALAACGSPPAARSASIERAAPSVGVAVSPPPTWNTLVESQSFSYTYWTVPAGFARDTVDFAHVSCTTDVPRAGKSTTRCERGRELGPGEGGRFFACTSARQIQPDAALLRAAERALAAGRAPESARANLVIVLSTVTRRHVWVDAVAAIEVPPFKPPPCYGSYCPPPPIDDSPVHSQPAIPAHEEIREERSGPTFPALPGRVLSPGGTFVLSELLPEHVVGNAFTYDERVALNRADRSDAFFRDLEARLRAFDPRGAEPFERAAYHANLALLAVQRGDLEAARAQIPALEEDRRAVVALHIPWTVRYEQSMSAIGSVARALAPLAAPNVTLGDPCAR